MRCLVATLLIAGLGWVGDEAARPANGQPTIRFEAVDVFVDGGDAAIGAYQLELSATAGNVKIVGIEGGDHPLFRDPPYYDPAAMQNDRVIIAAFSTAAPDHLPHGRTRMATIHVQVTGERQPEYRTQLVISADADGQPIDAELTLETGQQK